MDPAKAAAAAPSGADSIVLDLSASLVAGDGQSIPDVVDLHWTGMLPGDYDQNGEVNASDLAPLALHWGETVEYLAEPPLPEAPWWPAGDVTDTGGADPGTPPAAGSGAHNWRLARIDGDHNGEINTGDIAAIARHWMERASGYRVYRRGPGGGDFELLPNPASAASLVTRERPVLGPGMPERYTFSNALSAAGEYSYYVTPYDVETGLEGGQSATVDAHSDSAPSIQLLAEPTEGNSPLTVSFTVSPGEGSGELVHYAWDFDGDGEADQSGADLGETSHIYETGGSYYPSVEVTDDIGKLAGASANIRVDYPPIAFFTADATAGTPPLTVMFDASGSTDPGGQIVIFRWDLDGDGTYELEGMNALVEHEFTESGTHIVRLQVEDNDGFTDTTYRTIRLNTPPIAHYSVESLKQTTLFVHFDPALTIDADGDALTLEWDFEGDAEIDQQTTDANVTVSHYYEEYGEYTPVLKVTDSHGASDTFFLAIRLMAEPVAALTHDTKFGGLPLTVSFDASGSSDEDGTIEFYEFDFDGDGAYDTPKQTEPFAEYTFEDFDAYMPHVRVTDNDGNVDDTYAPTIHTSLWRPVAEFESVQQNNTTGGFSALQVGDRMAVAFSTLQGGLFIQFSEAGTLENWDPPINLLPSSNISAQYLIEINGAPCLFFIDDTFLYVMRSENASGGIWTPPVQVAPDPIGWRQFFDVRVIDGMPYATYYTSLSFSGPDEDGIYFVRGNDPDGTDWAFPQQLWSPTGFGSFGALFLSAAGGEPSVFYEYDGAINLMVPLDPLFLLWTTLLAAAPAGSPEMPDVQRNLDFESFPFTCIESDTGIGFKYYDEMLPEGFVFFPLPLDYGSINGYHASASQLFDGLPHLPVTINQDPPPGMNHPSVIHHYQALEPSLSSWVHEPICTAGYVYVKELGEFDGQMLAIVSPHSEPRRSILLLRGGPGDP